MMGQRGWIKVISEAEKNERKSHRSFRMNIENAENFEHHQAIPPPTTKGRVRNRNPLKRDVYRIEREENSCIYAGKFADERKTCSWKSHLKEDEEELAIVSFKKVSLVLYVCRTISTLR